MVQRDELISYPFHAVPCLVVAILISSLALFFRQTRLQITLRFLNRALGR